MCSGPVKGRRPSFKTQVRIREGMQAGAVRAVVVALTLSLKRAESQQCFK